VAVGAFNHKTNQKGKGRRATSWTTTRTHIRAEIHIRARARARARRAEPEEAAGEVIEAVAAEDIAGVAAMKAAITGRVPRRS